MTSSAAKNFDLAPRLNHIAMLEVIFHPLPKPHTTIHEVPVPAAGPHEVVIKVEATSSNPKDWGHPVASCQHLNSGDDLAGTIYAVGSAVQKEFKTGDRVTAFHKMFAPHGAYAEYAVAPAHTVSRIPSAMTFDEASTIPLVSITAAITLFRRQRFQAPWLLRGDENQGPLIIYGASSALGAFLVKLAKLSAIQPIVAIGGGSAEYVRSLLSPSAGDIFVDYRGGPDKMKKQVREALGDLRVRHAVDAISAKRMWIPVSQMLDSETSSILSVMNGANTYDEPEIAPGVRIVYTYVGTAHSGRYLPSMPKQPSADDAHGDIAFATEFFIWLERVLQEGKFDGHPHEVISGGLEGVQEGLRRLQNGEAQGKKFVYRISETPSLVGSRDDNNNNSG